MEKAIMVALMVSFLTGCLSSTELSDAHNPEAVNNTDNDPELIKKLANINVDSEDTGIEPVKYKRQVMEAIEFALEYPESAKFSHFTEPRKEVLLSRRKLIYGYSVCVDVNEKGASGTYTGDTRYWVFMRDDKILRIKNTRNPSGKIIFPGRNIRCD